MKSVIFKRIIILILISLSYSVAGGIASFAVSKIFDFKFQDTMTIIGFLSLALGMVLSMKNSNNTVFLTTNKNSLSSLLYFTANMKDNYHFNKDILNLSFMKLVLIIGGIFLIGFSILFSL